MTTTLPRPHTRFGTEQPHFAAHPVEADTGSRADVRLLVAGDDTLRHAAFPDLVDALDPGDVLVVNTSATVPGEADAIWYGSGGGRPVVAHLAAAPGPREWIVELRTVPNAAHPILDAAPGDLIELPELPAAVRLTAPYPELASPTGTGNRIWSASIGDDLRRGLDTRGRPIAYGYLDRRWPLAAYQTVFGRVPGSAEMASAGRPFTAEIVLSLLARGIQFAPVVLHTAFSSQEAGEPPLPEWFELPAHSARVINQARAAGRRIIAVGTTATRATESAVTGDTVQPRSGWTTRVITPQDPPRVIDGLLTGWHNADASHLLLVEAVAGPDLTQRAYDAALAAGYAWHEFGDSCLLLPPRR
ncbi:S-adenosylmethionine:tRNA ribosyltransferase-isomerase [Granulicoccus phenolivorans]|uniref:S-adenosylmethionine:tRNA ribosyltransferase-isomerase n=1 Tax=Granulicoccus phenolivorans TaxID=266854 RepID=UPI0004226412|nr:S-adenosylmethionine:tRNA ribosyltransferase-isomerase [Granulicoccus phenolivorans]